jgi:DNA-binding MarR family transcriptional regulator
VAYAKAERRNAQSEGLPERGGDRRERERPEPLSLGVLNDHLGYFVRRLQVWVFQDFMQGLAALEVRPAQFSVLAVIEANPGLSQSDIAAFLGIERARLVRLLDRLEKRGFTERRASPRDRRSHALHLTREGQRALKRIKALAAAHEARLTEKLNPERRKLLLDLLRDFGR